MEHHAKLDIDVMVSQELRDIIASRKVTSRNLASRQREAFSGPVRQRVDPDALGVFADYMLLQRYGQRPLKFMGTAVVTFAGVVNLLSQRCHWDVLLSISTAQTPYLSIRLDMPDCERARSLFLAEMLDTRQNFALPPQWLQQIKTTVSAALPQSQTIMTDTEINRAFHEITHNCFRSAQYL